MRIAILGANGYTAHELVRMLIFHKNVDHIDLVSTSLVGKKASEIFGNIASHNLSEEVIGYETFEQREYGAVFSALPHGASAKIIGGIDNAELIVDLSADFRLKDTSVYEAFYGKEHPYPGRLTDAVYGLTEWNREALKTKKIIANPGCYPTSVLMAVLPFLERGIEVEQVVINSLSGISGAGKSPNEGNLFCSRSENAEVYNAGQKHRHIAEMAQEMDFSQERLVFNPHLIPLKCGIISTITLLMNMKISTENISEILVEKYNSDLFVGVKKGSYPSIKEVAGTNNCCLSGEKVKGGIQIYSAIDNLMKGASSQAIQNFNVYYGFNEAESITFAPRL